MADSIADIDTPISAEEAEVQKATSVRRTGPSDLSDTGADTEVALASTGMPDPAVVPQVDNENADEDELLIEDAVPTVWSDEDELDSDTDSGGTGERASADEFPNDELNQDIGFDRIVPGNDAGLGGGLDQAEEANLGITDEALFADLDDDDDPI